MMTSFKGIFRFLFVLLTHSAIWSLCVCKPIKNEELSPLDEDLFDRYFSQKPFWPPTLRPPFVWPTVAWTHRPLDFYNKHNTTTSTIPIGLRVLIFILIGIAGLVALLCKYYVCKTCASSSASESSAVVHPPPERILPTNLDRNSPQIQYRIMPPYAGASTSLNRNPPQIQHGLMPTYAGPSTSLNRNPPQIQHGLMPTYAGTSNNLNRNTQLFQNGTGQIDTGTSNTYNITDKPPSYSDVVTSDLIGGNLKFPDVSETTPCDSPPPKYEKGEFPKF